MGRTEPKNGFKKKEEEEEKGRGKSIIERCFSPVLVNTLNLMGSLVC